MRKQTGGAFSTRGQGRLVEALGDCPREHQDANGAATRKQTPNELTAGVSSAGVSSLARPRCSRWGGLRSTSVMMLTT